MATKHMKIYFTLLNIREMQIRPTLRYHYTPIKLYKIKQNGHTKYWQTCEEHEILIQWWECKIYNHFGK